MRVFFSFFFFFWMIGLKKEEGPHPNLLPQAGEGLRASERRKVNAYGTLFRDPLRRLRGPSKCSVGDPVHPETAKRSAEPVDRPTQPQSTYRHRWPKDDMVTFNNPGLLHRSHPYEEASGRIMHRTTLKGDEIERQEAMA